MKNVEKLKKGLWNIYKPKGASSFDVVRGIKKMTGEQKVGHAGTLDPLAEGVLIVGVGREATKQLRFVLEEDKEYIGEIKLGMTSTTDDEEGQKTLTRRSQDTRHKIQTNFKSQISKVKVGASEAGLIKRSDSKALPPSLKLRRIKSSASNEQVEKIGRGKASTWPNREEIEKVLQTFIGDIIQISPSYSAIKIGGERAYKKARRGEKFTRPPRIVTIKEIEILDYQLKTFREIKQADKAGKNISIPAGEYPVLKIKTVVDSGTYIRSLAREIGEKLEIGSYLTSLVRTRIGKHKIEEAIKLEL